MGLGDLKYCLEPRKSADGNGEKLMSSGGATSSGEEGTDGGRATIVEGTHMLTNDFFHSYRKTRLEKDEIIRHIDIPLGAVERQVDDGTGTFSPSPRRGDGASSPGCLLYTSPSPRDATLSRMPSSA